MTPYYNYLPVPLYAISYFSLSRVNYLYHVLDI